MTEQMRQAMKERHTVRQFDGTPLTDEEKSTLQTRVDELNKTYDLAIALIESEKSPLSFLAPTAINMQNFNITGKGNKVTLTYKSGPMSGIDKGIIKHHFELGAGKENFEWA